MAYRIVWTNRAISNFEKVIRYLRKEWSDKSAHKFTNEFEKQLEIISKNPVIGQTTSKSGSNKLLITRHNKLYYRIEKNKSITLLYIFDTRQHPKKIDTNK